MIDGGDDGLVMWVIYERPRDYPTGFVVRRQVARRGRIEIDNHAAYAPTLEEARKKVPPNCYRMARDRNDEPQIVEVWL